MTMLTTFNDPRRVWAQAWRWARRYRHGEVRGIGDRLGLCALGCLDSREATDPLIVAGWNR